MQEAQSGSDARARGEPGILTASLAPRRDEIRIALVVLACSLLARMHSLSLSYSLDDYGHFLDPNRPALAVNDGRPVEAALIWLLDALGAPLPYTATIGWVTLTGVLIGTGLYFCRAWRIDDRPLVSTVAVLLFVLHPFQTEIFTFHAVTLLVAIAIATAISGLAIAGEYGRRWWSGVVLLALSFGIYQLTVNYVALGLLLTVPFRLDEPLAERRRFFVEARWRAGAIAAGLLLYYVGVRIFAALLGIPPNTRSGLLRIGAMPERVRQAAELALQMFWQPGLLIPRAPKLLLAVSALAFIASLLARADQPHRRRMAASFGTTLLVAVPFCLGITMLIAKWWPAIRMFAHVGLLWAAVFGFALTRSTPPTRRGLFVAAALIVFSFIGIDAHLTMDELRLNRRDQAEVNRIVMRLELLPNFQSLQGLEVVGGPINYPAPITGSDGGDLNRSALNTSWSKIPLFTEVSGYAWREAPASAQPAINAYCKRAPKWPDAASVTALGPYGVVCLP